jgi:hypothetical protein
MGAGSSPNLIPHLARPARTAGRVPGSNCVLARHPPVYVTITVDLGANPPTITGRFNSVADPPTEDAFVLNLKTGAIKTQ